MTEQAENHAIQNAKAWLETIRELAARLRSDDDGAREAAQEEASESALSVMVRDDWRAPGSLPQDSHADEYEVLLTTGGPALRIWGKLGNFGEPDEWPHLQWQDWGTPWTDYPLGEERDDVCAFLGAFYFGEG